MQCRRLQWVGHLLRGEPANKTCQDMLRYSEAERRGWMQTPGGILSRAQPHQGGDSQRFVPIHNNRNKLVVDPEEGRCMPRLQLLYVRGRVAGLG
eukprot:SAG31_NODE_1084_length_10007_cov_4.353452_4_plen_95_part_00